MTNPPRPPDPPLMQTWDPQAWFAPAPDGDLVPGGSAAAWVPPGPKDEGDPPDDPSGDDAFLRPFILTQGRTRPLHDGLRIETQILASPAVLSAPLKYERRRIVELCQRPLSVAEVAAGLGVPLGVARVLIADLAAENLVALQEPAELPINIIERIRDLVREL